MAGIKAMKKAFANVVEGFVYIKIDLESLCVAGF